MKLGRRQPSFPEFMLEQPKDLIQDTTDSQSYTNGGQTMLRKLILAIQSDTTLTPKSKARKMQDLMSMNWAQSQKSTFKSAEIPQEKVKCYHDKEKSILGCKHYQRAAKLQANCCGKWFTCRFCHDDASNHTLVRALVSTMQCMNCETIQPCSSKCINIACQMEIASYYCPDCKLWDNDKRKNIYHCHECGICRIGKGLGEDYFHCKKCNVCMAMSLLGHHKCIERNLESDCPICGEYMFTSTTTVMFMPCGHCIHYKCHQEYIQTNYQCPTCSKSLANMTEYFNRIDIMLKQHTMPPEYQNTKSYIYCNDCELKSYAPFHFLYHKCNHCRGYNTKVLKTIDDSIEDET